MRAQNYSARAIIDSFELSDDKLSDNNLTSVDDVNAFARLCVDALSVQVVDLLLATCHTLYIGNACRCVVYLTVKLW